LDNSGISKPSIGSAANPARKALDDKNKEAAFGSSSPRDLQLDVQIKKPKK